MVKPAGVIYDFDGVVVDSLAVHLAAWRDSYSKLFNTELGETAGLAGRSTSAIAEILSQRAGQPLKASALAELKRQTLREARYSIPPIAGALEAFAWLKRESIPFGIASNAPRAFINHTLQDLGVIVNHIFGLDDVPRPKPAPDVFLLCARSIGIHFLDHSRTIVFEDSVHGLKAAVLAGMHPIGITTQNSDKELLEGGAIKTCRNITEAFEHGWFREI